MKYTIILAMVVLMSVQQVQAAKKPQIWMAVLPADVLVQPGAQWDFVKKNVDGIKFWTQQVDYPAKDWPLGQGADTPDALKKLIAVMNEHHIPLIIEKACFPQAVSRADTDQMGGKPGPFDDTFSQRASDNELERIGRIEALGGKVSSFDVDGPMRHMIHPITGGKGFESMDRAAEQFARYMVMVHEKHPEIGFYALTNFPNWGWKGEPSYPGTPNWGDYYKAVEAIIRNAKKLKAPLRGITVDNPYDYATGRIGSTGDGSIQEKTDWVARIIELERYVHSQGLEFNLIVNSEGPGQTSMEDYNRETLAYIDLYKKRGGNPDRYIVQSWYPHPTRQEVLPESSPNTFTGLVKEVIKRVKGVTAKR